MSSHDESETCQTCHVLHSDGPAHICNPYAVRWPEGPTDAEVKRGLNRLMSTMADMVTKLSAENRELKERITLAETLERHADDAGSVDALARAAAEQRAQKAEALADQYLNDASSHLRAFQAAAKDRDAAQAEVTRLRVMWTELAQVKFPCVCATDDGGRCPACTIGRIMAELEAQR